METKKINREEAMSLIARGEIYKLLDFDLCDADLCHANLRGAVACWREDALIAWEDKARRRWRRRKERSR